MEFTLTIECDNAAFADGSLAYELRTIMSRITGKIEGGAREGNAIDTNGNVVGGWSLGGDAAEEENEDQDEAENIAQNIEHLYDLGQAGDADGLEAAFREYAAENNGVWVDCDNVDFDQLVEFLQS